MNKAQKLIIKSKVLPPLVNKAEYLSTLILKAIR
jgi:hypothetical protein